MTKPRGISAEEQISTRVPNCLAKLGPSWRGDGAKKLVQTNRTICGEIDSCPKHEVRSMLKKIVIATVVAAFASFAPAMAQTPAPADPAAAASTDQAAAPAPKKAKHMKAKKKAPKKVKAKKKAMKTDAAPADAPTDAAPAK